MKILMKSGDVIHLENIISIRFNNNQITIVHDNGDKIYNSTLDLIVEIKYERDGVL
jgi:3D (Asp-Asp-Asp) domain-containing protein